MTAQKYCLNFNEIDKNDLPLVGGKGANLGEITKAGFPVPEGFCVTVQAFELFIAENEIRGKIKEIIDNTDIDDPAQLQSASRRIRQVIVKGKVPDQIKNDIYNYYQKLSSRILKPPLVAARSSATAEDLPNASFAGQQATFLNVKGDANLINAVRECWASLYTARAIFYRAQNKISERKVGISVVVQKMIQSEVSGVAFTIDPVTNDKERIIIEAVWGLGELIVQGAVVPDRYVVQKGTFSILSKKISEQKIQLIKVGHKTKESNVPKAKIEIQKLSDQEIISLAKIADKLQKHYYFPQDIEWARESKNLYIVQTRPVTTAKSVAKIKKEQGKKGFQSSQTPILTGSAASPGVATGMVRIVKKPSLISKVKKGEVLVSIMTSPDFVPAMKKAAAIITDKGGQTSHAAIVSRELGVPCVVGTKLATKKLKEGIVVTVDGSKGLVYMGSKVKITTIKEKEKKSDSKLKTATKLYVNLAEPELANKVSKKNVDGVGLLRAEFIIAGIGIHPKEAIRNKKTGAVC